MKICQEHSNVVKIGQTCRTLYMTIWGRCIVCQRL